MKFYSFNNEKYTNLNSLAQAYAANFKLGVEDIFTNYKKLVKFVSKLAKDKVGLVVDYLSKSKYKNDALTFIIFELLDEKKVYFNGVDLTFDEFLLKLKENPDPENNLLYVFIEDGGLSKTYARFDILNLEADAKEIERNISDPFVFDFLINYNNYSKRDPFVQINQDLLDSPRVHDKFLKKVKEYDFMMNLAHYDFSAVYVALHDESPAFEVLNILYRIDGSKADELIKVLTNTPEGWLVDHLKSYKAKSSQAKELFKKINETVANSKKKEKVSKKQKPLDPFVKTTKLHNELFDEYSLFVKMFSNGEIVLKKKQDDLVFEKEYAGTLVTSNYMLEIPDEEVLESKANNIMPVLTPTVEENTNEEPVGEVTETEVTKPTEVEPVEAEAPQAEEVAEDVEVSAEQPEEVADETEATEEVTQEPAEETSLAEEETEAPKEAVLEVPADDVKYVETKPESKSLKNLDLKALNRTKKINHKNRSFGGYVIFISVLNAILISLVAFLPKIFVDNQGIPQQVRDIAAKLIYTADGTPFPNNFLYYAIISGGLFVINLVLVIILKSLSKKNERKLIDLQIYMNSNSSVELGESQELAKAKVSDDLDAYKKCIKKKYYVLSWVVGFFHAMSVSILGMMICVLLPNFVTLPVTINTNPSIILFTIAILSGAVLTVLMLLIKPKKSRWYVMLLDLLVLASVFAVLAFIKL